MTYLVSGCGVSMLCDQRNVMGWVEYILDKGGTPRVQVYKDYEARR